MKNISKWLAALCAVALFGAMMVGCSGQAASSSSSAAPEPVKLTADELVAELDPIAKDNNYKSVTLDMTGTIKMDFAEMLGLNDEAASDEAASADTAAASAEAASTDETSAEAASAEAAATEAASDASASADAADAQAEGDDSVMEMPINTHAECDISDGTVKMHINMDMAGMQYELFINGQDAVVVMGGKAAKTTLAELGMEQYSSVESIMKNQMGDVDLSALKDGIKSAEKLEGADETVYTVTLDSKAFVKDNEQLQSLQMLGEDFMDDITMVYRVNADKKLSGLDISMSGKGYSSDIACKLSNYDSTTVPAAPEATMTLEELSEAVGQDLSTQIEQELTNEISNEVQTDKAA